MHLTAVLSPKKCSAAQYAAPIRMKPSIYPPVIPNSTAAPPLKPENTGTPTSPRSIYTAMARVPRFPPRSVSAQAAPNVCSVMGTAPIGTAIHEHMAIITAISAVNVMSFTVSFNFITSMV